MAPAWFATGIRTTGGERIRISPALHRGAVIGAPNRPKCCLPESLCLAPSPRFLLRTSRWNRPSCIPPLAIAEFEQRVLNKHGLAQVGFGGMIALLSFHLTIYSRTQSALHLVRAAAAHAPLWGLIGYLTGSQGGCQFFIVSGGTRIRREFFSADLI